MLNYKDQLQHETHWLKRARIILLYHTFQVLQHGDKRNHGWRLEDTARELKLSKGYISESISLAKHFIIDVNLPESRDVALKVMKGKS